MNPGKARTIKPGNLEKSSVQIPIQFIHAEVLGAYAQIMRGFFGFFFISGGNTWTK